MKKVTLTHQNQHNIILDKIINTIPCHVYWQDCSGIILGCNQLQAESLGFDSPDKVIGKHPVDLVPKNEAAALLDILKQVVSTKKVITLEEHITFKQGAIYLFSYKIPLIDENNKVFGMAGVSIDISDRKKAEQLEVKKAVAEKQHQQAEIFASALAHELRTPLSGINAGAAGLANFLPNIVAGFAKAQEKNQIDKENFVPRQKLSLLAGLCERIKKQAAYANLFIDMALKNIRHKSIDTSQFSAVSIKGSISDMLSRYPLEEQEQPLVIWQPDQFDDFIYSGDKTLTIHVLFNLLKNALFYIRYQQGAAINIQLQQGVQGNKLLFTDTGKGIPENVLPNIFKAFYTKRTSGSGVGLAFCKMVMASYGGDIQCESQEGEYTTFILIFPTVSLEAGAIDRPAD